MATNSNSGFFSTDVFNPPPGWNTITGSVPGSGSIDVKPPSVMPTTGFWNPIDTGSVPGPGSNVESPSVMPTWQGTGKLPFSPLNGLFQKPAPLNSVPRMQPSTPQMMQNMMGNMGGGGGGFGLGQPSSQPSFMQNRLNLQQNYANALRGNRPSWLRPLK